MNIKSIINESIVEYVSETQEVWYHGTPDNREVKEMGSFQPKTNTTDYITDPQKQQEILQQMQDARSTGNEDLYFELLDEVGKLRKELTYNKPIYFTNKRSVANTYADDKRAFDYQNADPSIYQAKIDDSGNVLKVPAFGERFRGIKADVVKRSFMNAGVPEQEVDKYFGSLTNHIRNGKMTSETLGIIAQQLGFDIIDVLGVLDSYHGGDVKSTVRMVFDPSRITLQNNVNEVLFESENIVLSEKDFYKKYVAIHKDLRTKGESKNAILKNGFYEGNNVNAMPFSRYYDAPTSTSWNPYKPKTGDFVWLLTKDGVFEGPNGYKTVKGYIPDPCDGFFIVDGDKTVYENYLIGCK